MKCDSDECSSEAVYLVTLTLYDADDCVRRYCPSCTEALVVGAARVLGDEEQLHEYVEVEHVNV